MKAEQISEAIVKTIRPLHQRVVALETRLNAFEKKPYVKFCGVWTKDQTYQTGDAATHHGGLWICRQSTSGEPSKDFAGWQLAVKRGDVSK